MLFLAKIFIQIGLNWCVVSYKFVVTDELFKEGWHRVLAHSKPGFDIQYQNKNKQKVKKQEMNS